MLCGKSDWLADEPFADCDGSVGVRADCADDVLCLGEPTGVW